MSLYMLGFASSFLLILFLASVSLALKSRKLKTPVETEEAEVHQEGSVSKSQDSTQEIGETCVIVIKNQGEG